MWSVVGLYFIRYGNHTSVMQEDERKSVLVVHHRDLASPIGTTFFYYIADTMSDRHEIHAVCRRRSSERDETSAQGAVLHDIDTGNVPILSGVLFHCLAALYVLYLSVTNRYDVTYCSQSSILQGWLGALFGGSRMVVGLVSVPVRQTQDFKAASGSGSSVRGRVMMAMLSGYARTVRILLERASDVVCLTEGIRDVTERVYDVDLSEAHIIGMGVDVEAFSAPNRSDSADGHDDGWTITYIGAVRETRNLEQVLGAMAELEDDVTFRIAGQGPDQAVDALIEEAERLGVSDQVDWLGFVPHEDIPALLSNTDFAVSPLPDIESYRISFPAKLLEYMAAGTVVVATDLPAHRALVEDDVNGCIYDGSRADLVETIADCTENERRMNELKEQARETAERYDWDVVVGEFEEAIFEPTPDRTNRRRTASTSAL